MDDEMLAIRSKALGHPARIRIVRLLAAQSECRGAEVFSELPLAQSTVSEHLRILKEAGLVSARAEGTSMTYCLDATALAELADALAALRAEAPASCKTLGAC